MRGFGPELTMAAAGLALGGGGGLFGGSGTRWWRGPRQSSRLLGLSFGWEGQERSGRWLASRDRVL